MIQYGTWRRTELEYLHVVDHDAVDPAMRYLVSTKDARVRVNAPVRVKGRPLLEQIVCCLGRLNYNSRLPREVQIKEIGI